MKVKDCNNCPFCVVDFDPDCMGYDTLLYCNLAHFNKILQNTIIAYDSWDEEKQQITTPEFCPLRQGNLTIELEEINK